MISTNAAPFGSKVVLSVKGAELMSATDACGRAFMLLVRRSIRRIGLLAAVTLTVNKTVPLTVSPWLRPPLIDIVGADTLGLAGSNTLGRMRLAIVVCPARTITPWNLLAALPGLDAVIS